MMIVFLKPQDRIGGALLSDIFTVLMEEVLGQDAKIPAAASAGRDTDLGMSCRVVSPPRLLKSSTQPLIYAVLQKRTSIKICTFTGIQSLLLERYITFARYNIILFYLSNCLV